MCPVTVTMFFTSYDVQNNMDKIIHVIIRGRILTYSFFILCTELHVVRMHTTFCGSFPQHIKVYRACCKLILVFNVLACRREVRNHTAEVIQHEEVFLEGINAIYKRTQHFL
jgi:hypothetical protein